MSGTACNIYIALVSFAQIHYSPSVTDQCNQIQIHLHLGSQGSTCTWSSPQYCHCTLHWQYKWVHPGAVFGQIHIHSGTQESHSHRSGCNCHCW